MRLLRNLCSGRKRAEKSDYDIKKRADLLKYDQIESQAFRVWLFLYEKLRPEAEDILQAI